LSKIHIFLGNDLYNYSGELKKLKDPQRLNGEDADNAYAIVQTTSKVVEEGLTRPPAYIAI